eukprot:1515234-Rhodomonas_salina.1
MSESMSLMGAENPTFQGQAGAHVNVIHGRASEDGGESVDEVEGAVLESVMRINAFARRVRRARAQAIAAR